MNTKSNVAPLAWRRVAIMVGALALIVCGIESRAQETGRAEALRDALSDQARSVKSFKARYVYTQKNYFDEGFEQVLEFEQRFWGPNRYWQRKRVAEPEVFTMASRDGVMYTLYAKGGPGGDLTGNITGQVPWSYEQGSYVTPADFLGYLKLVPLEDRLASGECSVSMSDGHEVLTHIDLERASRVDFHLDDQYRIVRIDEGSMPSRERVALFQKVLGGHPRDAATMWQSYEVTAFSRVNGVDIPVEGQRTTLARGERAETADRFWRMLERGEGDMDSLKKLWDESRPSGLRCVQTISVDPSTAAVNTLTADDFKLQFPTGTRVFDHFTNTEFTVGKGPEVGVWAADLIARVSEESGKPQDASSVPLESDAANKTPYPPATEFTLPARSGWRVAPWALLAVALLLMAAGYVYRRAK